MIAVSVQGRDHVIVRPGMIAMFPTTPVDPPSAIKPGIWAVFGTIIHGPLLNRDTSADATKTTDRNSGER